MVSFLLLRRGHGPQFPGQGAQTVGMAKAVCNELPAAKALFDKASEILGYDLLETCAEVSLVFLRLHEH